MEKILVLTDFSDIADKGLETAVTLAKQFGGAEILLLNTEPPVGGREVAFTGDVTKQHDREEDHYMIELIRKNKERLIQQADKYIIAGVTITPYIEVGDMQKVVTNFLHKHTVDLVVMGTSGENTIEEYFVGNHTEQVIRVSDVPVISVKPGDFQMNVKNIVLATDMNENAYKGLRHIRTFAEKLDAQLHLVHVTNSSSGYDKIKNDINRYAKNHNLRNFTVNVILDSDTEDGIKKFAAKIGADMIAVITHGHHGLRAVLTHSVAEDIIKEAPIPVMTVNMKEAR